MTNSTFQYQNQHQNFFKSSTSAQTHGINLKPETASHDTMANMKKTTDQEGTLVIT
jgi:hypothetical protein